MLSRWFLTNLIRISKRRKLRLKEVKELGQEPRTEGSGRLGREPHALSAHGFPTPPDAHPHQEHAMGIQMDPQLDAIDNLLARPLGDPKVGDQGHDRNCKEPEGNELGW